MCFNDAANDSFDVFVCLTKTICDALSVSLSTYLSEMAKFGQSTRLDESRLVQAVVILEDSL